MRDLESLKTKINQSDVLSDSEKKEWLALLPKMTERQLSELESILKDVQKSSPKITHEGEVKVEGQSSQPQQPSPKTIPAAMPNNQQPTPDDLKSLTLEQLKSASSAESFFAGLKDSVKKLNLSPDQAVTTFEQSPLFKQYMQEGLNLMSGKELEQLTRDQFEAIAEFRASLEKL